MRVRVRVRLRDEGDRGASYGAAEGAEHGAHLHGLRRGDGRVGVAHLRPRDGAALEDDLGLGAEEGRPAGGERVPSRQSCEARGEPALHGVRQLYGWVAAGLQDGSAHFHSTR